MRNIFTSLFAIIAVAFTSQAQNTWTQKADFGGGPQCWSAAFSIGDRGYVEMGFGFPKGFWEYDPTLNVWTQKADFGGIGRAGSICFSIGDKGYVGAGGSFDTINHYYKDFWEYDQQSNVWTQKTDVGGPNRVNAVSFSIGSKGYAGTGYDGYSIYFQDFWEYDPATDYWTQKADFATTGRQKPVGFSIGNKGYVGMGSSMYGYEKDFWEYDQSTNTWTQKADLPASPRYGAVGFGMGNKGYVGTGYSYDGNQNNYKDFWEFDPDFDAWTQKADFGGSGRYGAIGFSIGDKGYLGTGISSDSSGFYIYSDFWEYTPKFVGITSIKNDAFSLSVFPNPTNDVFSLNLIASDNLNGEAKIELLNSLGQIAHSENATMVKGKLQQEIQLSDVAEGIYLVHIKAGDACFTQPLIVQR